MGSVPLPGDYVEAVTRWEIMTDILLARKPVTVSSSPDHLRSSVETFKQVHSKFLVDTSANDLLPVDVKASTFLQSLYYMWSFDKNAVCRELDLIQVHYFQSTKPVLPLICFVADYARRGLLGTRDRLETDKRCLIKIITQDWIKLRQTRAVFHLSALYIDREFPQLAASIIQHATEHTDFAPRYAEREAFATELTGTSNRTVCVDMAMRGLPSSR